MRHVFLAVVIAAIGWALVPALADAATNPADAAIVKAGLLTINDVPPGWAEASRPSSPEPDLSKYGRNCAAIQKSRNAAKKLPTARGKSHDFNLSNDGISNSVATYRTVAAAGAGVAYLTNAGFTECLQRYFTDRLDRASKKGVTSKTSVGRLSVPNAGDSTLGFQNVVTSTSHGQTVTAYTEVEDVQVGRTEVSFIFSGGGPSLLTNNQALVRSVVTRLRAAEDAPTRPGVANVGRCTGDRFCSARGPAPATV
jgi:hypothetical protein